jgi:hypothetical protein
VWVLRSKSFSMPMSNLWVLKVYWLNHATSFFSALTGGCSKAKRDLHADVEPVYSHQSGSID